MTIKQFVRSESFKSIVVLLLITLVCGTILAIANDIFYISDAERLNRAVKKIYGEDRQAQVEQIQDLEQISGYGSIDELYKVDDGSYLIKATGINGFNGGTVTLWVKALTKDGKFSGIDKVVVASNEKQTFMSKFDSKFFDEYTKHNDKVSNGSLFDKSSSDDVVGNLSTGATFTTKAMNNAINAAIMYMRIVINGEVVVKLPESNGITLKSTQIVNDNQVKYNLISAGAFGDYEMELVVDASGLVSILVVNSAAQNSYPEYYANEWKQEQLNALIGKSLEELKEIKAPALVAEGTATGQIITGATRSNEAMINSVIYAVANYDHYIQLNQEGGNVNE